MASSTSPLELLVLRLEPAACDRRGGALAFPAFAAGNGATLADLSLAVSGGCDAVAPDRVARGVGYFSSGLTKDDIMIR